MAAIAAGIGRAQMFRTVRNRRYRRSERPGAYIAPHDYIPSGTADLWRSARRQFR